MQIEGLHSVDRWYQNCKNWHGRPIMADHLAVATIVSIPWSTSLTSILIVVWLITIMPGTSLANIHRALTSPPSALPILLVLLAVAGLIWTDANPYERFAGLRQFLKLLIIPILLTEFRESENGKRAIVGFLISCVALLVLSIASAIWPVITWWRPGNPGVPFKDQTAQSAEFTICAFCLIPLAVNACREQCYARGAALFILPVAFLGDVFYIATSRAQLVVISVLTLLICVRMFKWKGAAIALAVMCAFAAAVWYSSPYLQKRIYHGEWEYKQYVGEHRPTSIGDRLDWWRQSFHYWKAAPIIGYGTGSIEETFRRGAETPGIAGQNFPTSDIHNQVLDVAVQFGLIGVATLLAMWIAHFVMFRDSGHTAWFGSVIVVQNIVACMFHSHIKDFTEGWIYVFGVGVLGGMVQRSLSSTSSEVASRNFADL